MFLNSGLVDEFLQIDYWSASICRELETSRREKNETYS